MRYFCSHTKLFSTKNIGSNIIEKTKMATIDIRCLQVIHKSHENDGVKEMLATEFSVNESKRIHMEHAHTTTTTRIKKRKNNQLQLKYKL